MQRPELGILIVTTQTWMQITRLALRFARYGCRVSALCPRESELQFLDKLHHCYTFHPGQPLASLRAAILRSGPQYVVPGDDLAVWLLHELSERSPQYRALVERSLGASRSFSTIRSRHKLLALAARLGIAVPETSPAPTPEDALLWSRGRGAPFVLKKDGTWGGGGVQVVSDVAALAHHYAQLTDPPTLMERVHHAWRRRGKRFILPPSWTAQAEISVQAYVEGVAANAMFACDQGRILGSLQARVVASKLKNGPAVMIDLIDDPRIARAGEQLAGSLAISGFFGLDFLLEQGTGIPLLLEMNPRCTQVAHVAMNGQDRQTDLAGILWSHWSGRALPQADADDPLKSSIGFYPHALEWGAGSSFLQRARLDVGAEDRLVVDRLASGNPALSARAYRAARRQLKTWKRQVSAPEVSPLYYFEPQAASPVGLASGPSSPPENLETEIVRLADSSAAPRPGQAVAALPSGAAPTQQASPQPMLSPSL